ncbi:IS3 family transposase [Gluconobacter wancherniae]|nr:transposase [Gluconobacter wancherniae]
MLHIRAIHAQSRRCYGSPRVTETLRARGFSAGDRRLRPSC